MVNAHTVVVGGTGVLGSLVVAALRRDGWRVTAASRHPRSREVRAIDPREPDKITACLADADIVVSTNPGPDLSVERAIVAEGGLCISPATVDAQALAAVEGVAAPKGTLVPHAGLTPGFSNLVVADLLGEPGVPARLRVGLTLSARGASGPGGRRWMHRLFSNASTASVVRHLAELGDRRCLTTPPALEGWHPELGNAVDQRLEFCMAEQPLNLLLTGLKRARLWPLLPDRIAIRPANAGAVDATKETVIQWVSVRDAARSASTLAVVRGDYRTTAEAVVAYCTRLLPRWQRGELAPGVLPLQQVLARGDLEAALTRAGMQMRSAQAT